MSIIRTKPNGIQGIDPNGQLKELKATSDGFQRV